MLVVFALRLSLFFTVSLIGFICSENEHTDLILKCLFFIVMVPILLGLFLHFIFDVYTCHFSHKIHDDLLVLVLSDGLVFSPEEKSRLLSKHCVCDY